MKLPETKKERIQTIALIVIGIIFVIYVSGSYAIKPLLNKRTKQLNRIEDLRSKIEMVENVVKLVKSGTKVNTEIITEIVDLTETSNYVMKARLGNYLIGATEIIEEAAKQELISLESIRELNITDIPGLNKLSNPFQLYSVRVSLECGMHDLVLLLRNIETSNPYLAISEISITGQLSKPGEHAVAFTVQWPIWRDEEIIANIIKSAETP